MNGLNQSKKIIHLVGKLNSKWDFCRVFLSTLKKLGWTYIFLRFVGSSPSAEISAAEQLIDIKSATSLRRDIWDMAMDGAGKAGRTLDQMGFTGYEWSLRSGLPGLVNIPKTMEHHHIFRGEINYFYGIFQLQTVSLPEGTYNCVTK